MQQRPRGSAAMSTLYREAEAYLEALPAGKHLTLAVTLAVLA